MAKKDSEELSAAEQAALKEAKKAHGLSEAELADLSPEEREAIEAEDEDDEHLRAIAAEGEEGADDKEEDGDDDDAKAKDKGDDKGKRAEAESEESEEDTDAEKDKGKAPAKADADDKEGEKDKDKAVAKDAGEDDDDDDIDVPMRPRMPRLTVKPVEKYDEQTAALDAEYDAVLKTYKEGDMPIDELLTKQRALDNKRLDLREAKAKADMALDHNQQVGQAEWMGDVQDFFGVVKEKEGIDYTKRALNVAFDDALKTLAADEKNADKSETWYLRQAHKMVKADLGLVAKKPDTDDKGGKDKDGKKLEGRKPKIALVPDLGKVPNASDGDGEDNAAGDPEFAALDRLAGQDYEDALAKMSQSKQDKYLRATR